MKTSVFLVALLLTAGLASAQESFPGIKSVLTAAEWQRAGLDRLTPDEVGVIDAALIRHQAGTTTRLKNEIIAAQPPATAIPAATAAAKPGFFQRFGLPIFDDSDWRAMPPLKARVVKWESSNRFRLDNGQVWEGFEAITYELVGKDIEIQARPHGQFALIVDGANTNLRVMRLR
ncbi:MAG: hypothetical protein PSV13_02530 [Lacunisphaera sp.]|nr:hypothetical protein [Lacunisphaera sp.]